MLIKLADNCDKEGIEWPFGNFYMEHWLLLNRSEWRNNAEWFIEQYVDRSRF
jgi:hypothetical protein